MTPQFHLPLLTFPEATSFQLVDNAIDLATHRKAELTVSLPQIRIPRGRRHIATALDIAALRAEAEVFSKENGLALATYLDDHCSKAGVSSRFHHFEAEEPDVCRTMATVSRSHEFSIVEASEFSRSLSEALLFEGGRPVILFPPSSFCGRIDNIAIAWDGSRTAARAVGCAHPFIEQAVKVQVISLAGDKPIDNTTRTLFLTSLQRSGLQVEDVLIETHGETPAAAIQSAAMSGNADLLIAGAFGHSRFREFILGGLTREILASCELPVLLAH